MLATGQPLLRVTLHCGTLHPQFLGATYTWWRASGRSQAVMIAHEVADLIPPRGNRVTRKPSIGPSAGDPSGESSCAAPSMAEGPSRPNSPALGGAVLRSEASAGLQHAPINEKAKQAAAPAALATGATGFGP
jgi:hypothetical protein